MKKIEMYLSNSEYDEFVYLIHKFHKFAENHEQDFLKRYSDQERAEVLNACEAVPFYVRLGIHLQMDAMRNCEEKKEAHSTVKPSEPKAVSVEVKPSEVVMEPAPAPAVEEAVQDAHEEVNVEPEESKEPDEEHMDSAVMNENYSVEEAQSGGDMDFDYNVF